MIKGNSSKAKRVAIVLVDSLIERLQVVDKATDFEDKLHASVNVGVAKRLRELIEENMG